MPIAGSTVVRRQLGRRLRRLRDAAGKTERDVQEASLASRVKLWRLETGKTAVKVADVRALCWLYGADAATTDALARMALGTGAQGWWEDYADVLPSWFGLYVGLEAAATEIRLYQAELVPGLLQTPDYISAVHRAADPRVDRAMVEGQIKLRQERQRALLHREPALRLTAVLGAGVLARRVGGAAAMAEQVHRLRELSGLDNVRIRVLDWDSGAHAAMLGSFNILDFADPDDPAVVYLESHTGARYLEKPVELAEYRRVFDLIHQQSVPIGEYPP